MTIDEALRSTSKLLSTAGIEESWVESEYLVAAALNIPKVRLAFYREQPISAVGERSLKKWRTERAQRKPLAYVLGEQPFGHLVLSVTPAVLVPRPETELLVERALKILDATPRRAVCADVGTGSGNIAICLAQHPEVDKVFGIDISEDALAVARRNAIKHGVQSRCQWRQGDLLAPLSGISQLDMVTANLPYVRRDEIERLAPELRWEPRLALDGGENGLDLIFRLIQQAETALRPQGILLLEIGATQGDAVLAQLAKGPWTSVRLLEDLAKLPRMIEARRKVH